MRVYAPRQPSYAPASTASRRGAGAAFALAAENTPRAAADANAPRPAAGIEVLIALQAIDEAGERRRRAVKQGRSALDALDALKVGLLGGEIDPGALVRLKNAAAELSQHTGDARLDGILGEIGLRAAVELAKLRTA